MEIAICSPSFHRSLYAPGSVCLHLGTEKFVVVLSMLHRGRIMVDQRHPLGQFRVLPNRLFQPFHAQHPGLVVVQAQADLCDLRVVMEKLKHGARGGPAKRNIVTALPVAPGQLHQRSQRERVNGAFGHRKPWTLRISRREGKIIPFVAALHINPKVIPRPPEAGKPGAARWVPTHKNTVMIAAAFIECTGFETRAHYVRVYAPALKI